MATILHDSDCATHNEPAMPNGPCSCGADKMAELEAENKRLHDENFRLREYGHMA